MNARHGPHQPTRAPTPTPGGTDADEGKLRGAARAWRTFAEAVEKLTGLSSNAARSVIEHNKVPRSDESW
ncbi:hypothetical protein [Streptomyces sp. H27-C3]|uniref:hypothetical protein n=1 Tax=Streptomyces sp. H27-C3 TaxID=3046305 RepID=UPI0024BAB331|nr:hypothetical protein [Streptomyces sp. H27-C3]MDJ0465274.1 hypothetical protein [Streptomyces sp. H27-C3]